MVVKKVREKPRDCHNHKPQPFPDPKKGSGNLVVNLAVAANNFASLFNCTTGGRSSDHMTAASLDFVQMVGADCRCL